MSFQEVSIGLAKFGLKKKKDVERRLHRALEYHRSGQIEEAQSCYRAILAVEPNHPDALHLLGMAFYQMGNHIEAEELIRKAIGLDGKAAFFHLNLGNVLKEQGKNYDAIAAFRKTIFLEPRMAEAHYNLANMLCDHGETENAVTHYVTAIRLNPVLAEAHYNLGKALQLLDRLEEAAKSYFHALELKPAYYEAHYNLGLLFRNMKKDREAIAHYALAVKIRPDYAEAHFNLANVLKDLERYEEAECFYKKAIKIRPDFEEAYNNLGIVYRKKGRIQEAIECGQISLKLKPDFAEAHNNLGITYRDDGQIEKAIESCERAIAIQLDLPEAHWNLALAQLHLGRFTTGWRKYEWRSLVRESAPKSFPYPRWDGWSLTHKTLFIYAEQGIGDQIMFASLFPDIMHLPERCIVECDDRLVPLFSRSFPRLTVIPLIRESLPVELQSVDAVIPMGSLPLHLRPNVRSFPQQKFYLIADPKRREKWQNRFSALGEGLKVGVSWRGGKESSVRTMRSTKLDEWISVLSVPHVHFINLQYGDCTEEFQSVRYNLGITIHDWDDADPLKDLDDFAAQIAELDLVISVDNSTVHMAGALGVPVWALLPRGCDWRWMKDHEDTPWYPSVRLFRQKQHQDWKKIFDSVSSFLREYAVKQTMPDFTIGHSYRNSSNYQESELPLTEIFPVVSLDRTYRCAVVTPVGPGHLDLYKKCLQTAQRAYDLHPGRFSEMIPLSIVDSEGTLGRSRARNLGVRKAAEMGVDWIFFIDADDEMAPRAFESVSPYLDRYDAIWGAIWPIEHGETVAHERPGQLPFLYSIEDVLSCDPFLTLQIGHFVKTTIALSEVFDESIDIGEDFDYYMRIWESYKCIKIPIPFFYNRRGQHSQGPRSATGLDWRKAVEAILHRYRRGSIAAFSYKGQTIRFQISNASDLIQQNYLRGQFFETKELEFIAGSVRPDSVILEVGANIGNHAVYYEKFMNPSKVILIEPNPRAIRLLKSNLEINGCSSLDISKLGVGVGKERGLFSLNDKDPNNLGAAHLESDEAGGVEVFPIDELIQEKIDFMKIDVEEMEMEVLEGARNTITAFKPDILIEIMNNNVPAFENMLSDINYTVKHKFVNINAVNFYVVPKQ
ncbi:MAG TPA: FkbM family methyltransferase [Thermodesulfovibrionales bacterium]|nr:FkbM family methyltransferase [Thermodesulfovibrionales bacterium]